MRRREDSRKRRESREESKKGERERGQRGRDNWRETEKMGTMRTPNIIMSKSLIFWIL